MYVKILKTMCSFKNWFTGVVNTELKKKKRGKGFCFSGLEYICG